VRGRGVLLDDVADIVSASHESCPSDTFTDNEPLAN